MKGEPQSLVAAIENKDLAGAQRLNAVLMLLPRYHTNRRWNARLANGLVRVLQRATPSRLFHDRSVFSRSIIVNDRKVGLRLLMPDGAPKGIYVHFHGGAWVLGNARLDDGITSRIAKECQLLAVAVDFHNAIDDRIDKSVDDCEAALEWVVRSLPALGAERIVVGGESSGAHLAAQALLRLRDRGLAGAFSGFVSTCGAFDFTGSPSLKRSTGRSLIVSGPSAYRNLQRLRPNLRIDEAGGPRFAPLHGLPPALFIAGEFDPIIDDSTEMYRCWQKANGNATLSVVPAGPHGFNRLPTAIAAMTNAFARRWIWTNLHECFSQQKCIRPAVARS